MSGRSPARLVIALSVAAVLAVFLVYTAVAGNSTPQLTPSQLARARRQGLRRRRGRRPDPRRLARARGLRFGLKNIQGTSGVVPVVYRGETRRRSSPSDAHVVVSGTYANGRLAGNGHPDEVPVEVRGRKPSA